MSMNFLSASTIRGKLSAAFGTALALLVAVGLFGLLQLHSVNAVTREMREVWLPRIETLNKIQSKITEHRLLATRRIQTTNFRELAVIVRSLDAALTTLRATEGTYSRMVDSESEQALFSEYGALWDSYEKSFASVLQRLEAGEISVGLQEFNSTALAAFDGAVEKLDRLIALSKGRSNVAAMHAQQVYSLAVGLTLGVILLAIAAAAGAMVWTSRMVSLPILRVTEAMRRLTAGDHAVGIAEDPRRKDEIGVLATAVAGYREALVRSRQLAEEAECQRGRLHAAVSNMPIGLVMFDSGKRLIICNDRYREIYDLPREATKPGTHLREVLEARLRVGNIEGGDREHYVERVLKLVEQKHSSVRVVELGDGRTISINHHPMEGGGWVGTHEDVTERRQVEARIHHMARHDTLTDLPNRNLFKERIEEALQRTRRGESMAVLCLDLDYFKNVNDSLGHPIGDALLRSVADRLRGAVREGDTVARLGGDEFAIVQLGAEQPRGATTLAERIIEMVGQPYEIDGHQVVIGTSVGIAVAPADGEDAEPLMKNADMALYRSKVDGRGRYHFFKPEMDAAMQARRALELDLRKALKAGEFEVHYQPIINLETREVSCCEALLRWRHPERGMVLPGEFIPLAEEIGLIVPLGEWVLRQACLDAVGWPGDVRVAVNVSAVQFKTARLTDTVIKALANSGLPPSRLELEITEGVLLIEHGATLDILHQLHGLGVKIAMDDFGTGYSSLSYLRSFPFDKIKIDQSFVRNMSEDESSLAIVRAVTGLSSSLGIVTTAEGVETIEQLESIRAEGCTEVQGFLVSAARPAGELATFIATAHKQSAVAA